SVWVGYDEVTQNTYLKDYQTRFPRLIFKIIMSQVSQGIDTPDFAMPSSVVKYGNELFVRGTTIKTYTTKKTAPKPKEERKERNTEQERVNQEMPKQTKEREEQMPQPERREERN